MQTVKLDWHLDRIDYQQDTIDIFVKDCYLDFNLLWKKATEYPNKKFNVTWHHAYFGETPPNVKIIWDIEKHSCIYETYDKLTTETFEKNIKDTVSSFNGSIHHTRTYLCIELLKNKMWNNKFCTKAFTDTSAVLSRYLPLDYQNSIVKILGQKKIKTFLGTINAIEYDDETRHEHIKNFARLKSRMDNTLINISTPAPNGTHIDSPCPDEKLILPIAAKSMWIAYACKGYHKFVEQFYGFKLFENTFDYSFDSEPDFFIRLQKIMSQLSTIHKLSLQDKMDIHNKNLDIMEYNYNHLTSGDWISHCKQAWQKYNLTNRAQDHIIEK